MKIISLTAENVKKLRVVSISPGDQAMVQITGPNGSGKSSVLDSIFYALAGGRALPDDPIRHGTERAEIRLDLGEYIVTRRFNAAGSTLEVKAADGKKFSSPQAMLDKLIGAISFDPQAFARMPAKEQYDTLRRLVPIDTDIDALDEANKADFAKRTDINREEKNLRAQAEGEVVPPDLPAERIDVKALMDRLTNLAGKNAGLEAERGRREAKQSRLVAVRDQYTRVQEKTPTEVDNIGLKWDGEKRSLMAQIALLQDRITIGDMASEQAKARAREFGDEQLRKLEEEGTALHAEISALPPLAAPEDVTQLRQEIDHATLVNGGIAMRDGVIALSQAADNKAAEALTLTTAIEERTKAKMDAIARAKMPIAGLGFAEGVVLYNGVALAQASAAEQLRVSVAIAMALNPTLRVMCVKEGSLLDSRALAMVKAMAEGQDYQVWIEQVDETGKVGIVMEDGAVAAKPASEAV